mmetsp:Transcript_3839/g.8195  ORF Transcript_3839/g.8195 Transcript_3839/m.8195 type:complete len:88 (-) Transcript_3839:861-1124(-)
MIIQTKVTLIHFPSPANLQLPHPRLPPKCRRIRNALRGSMEPTTPYVVANHMPFPISSFCWKVMPPWYTMLSINPVTVKTPPMIAHI